MPVVTKTSGKTLYRYRKQLFFAARGIVRVFDERDGTTTTCSPTDFEARATALGKEAARCNYPSERLALEDGANCMEKCAEEAVAQGDPTDPEVLAWHARHRAKGMILVGAGAAPLAGDRKLYVPGE